LLCKELSREKILSHFKVVLSLIVLAFALLTLTGLGGKAIVPAADDIGLQLDLYRLTVKPMTLLGTDDNASGLAYNRESDTLFASINDPEYLLELTKSGETIRRIELLGFSDTEAIVSLGGARFAILEERRRSVVIVDIHPDTTAIDRSEQQVFVLGYLDDDSNLGFEGIAYDSSKQLLYVVNEKSPRLLLSISGITVNDANAKRSVSVQAAWSGESLKQPFLDCDDYSGLHFDGASGRLLMLSDESRELTEVSEGGHILSRLDLSWLHRDLNSSIPNPEGVTMDAEGNVYILSEPNLFYRFSPGA
jgi:uncharacterized protein YjiK